MKYKLLISAMLIMVCTYSMAQHTYQWKTATAAGYTYKYVTNDPTASRFYTLKNGLTVVLSKDTKQPVIQFRLAVRAGSNTDPQNATGLAHYLEHLLFKGTDKFGTTNYAKEKPLLDSIEVLYEQYNRTTDPVKRKGIYAQIDKVSGEASNYAIAGEYDKMIRSLGGKMTNAHTSHEETVYKEMIPSNAIDRFLVLQAERFRNPVFRLFHTELETVYEEKNRGLDSDDRKVDEQTKAKLFPTHNYGQQLVIGTIEHLKNPSLVQIRNYYNRYYVPNNMLLVFVGDFDPDELIGKVDRSFAYMQPKPLDLYNPAPEKPLTAIQKVDVYGPDAESIKISYRGSAQNTRESLLLNLIAGILYNGVAGLMDINLNQQQKVQSAVGGYQQMKDYGIFSLTARPRKGQSMEQLEEMLLGQIELLKKGRFDESLVKAVIANDKLQRLKEFDEGMVRVSDIVGEFILNRGVHWDKFLSVQDDMARITQTEIIDFANQFFKDNYVVIYKRKGEDKSVAKVEKPIITAINTNDSAMSAFAEKLYAMPVKPVSPEFLDYSKELGFGKYKIADVVAVHNTSNSIFTMTYRFDIGTRNLPLLKYSLQYFPLLGTDKYSAADIKRQFYNIACTYNFSASEEASTITISGLQENFDQAVRLVEHILTGCRANDQVLAELKKGMLQERENNKSDKDYIQAGLASYALYGAANPFNTTLSNDEIEKISSEELLAIIHNFCKHKHVITYYGPRTLADFTADISRLHALPQTFTPAPPAKKFNYIPTNSNKVFFADYNMVQSEVHWIRNCGIYDQALGATVTLFNNYFGGGLGSVVFRVIRESKALAYSTDASFSTPVKKDDEAAMKAYVGCQADKLNDAVQSMNVLLNELPEIDKSFDVAKENALNIMATDRVRKDRLISAYFSDKRRGFDHDSRIDKYATLQTLSFADIQAFYAQYVAGKPYNYCITASRKKIDPESLKKLGEVHVLTLEQIFGY